MKTKVWIALLGLVLIVCVALSVFLLMPCEDAALAEIYSQGQLVRILDLKVDQVFTIETPGGGHNTVTVKDGKIAVTEANCPDHYCMDRGFCGSGAQIVCLPNKLVIQFAGPQAVDAMVG